jgi:hypothetical protein
MAAYADISATSYMVSVGSQSKIACYFTEDKVSESYNLEKKIYCPIIINNYHVIACIDNGSDLTVMQYNLFRDIFANLHRRLLKPNNLKTLKSFSEDSIHVHGQVNCIIRFTVPDSYSQITLTVIDDIPGVPLFLFGNDSLRKCCAVLAFAGDISNPTPEMIVRNPIEQPVKIFYEAPRDLFTCSTLVYLKPFETKSVTFVLNQAAPVLRKYEVIISSRSWGNTYVLPSKSDLEFDYKMRLIRLQPKWQI